MDLNLIKFIGVQYDNGTLESGNYKLYHSGIFPENLLSNSLYSEQDLYDGVKIYKENFPQTLIDLLQNDSPYEFVIEKV